MHINWDNDDSTAQLQIAAARRDSVRDAILASRLRPRDPNDKSFEETVEHLNIEANLASATKFRLDQKIAAIKLEEEEEAEMDAYYCYVAPRFLPKKTFDFIVPVAAVAFCGLTNIHSQIEAYIKQVGNTHFDSAKPIVHADTSDFNEVCDARIIASNSEFVAVSNGRKIELHRIANLFDTLEYDGPKEAQPHYSTVFAAGNVLNLKYKDGVACFAKVNDMSQERQREIGKNKGISR